ncbi:nucleotidyltransferase domain-containing protein [Clostridium ganghwense]|uniref:Nucleotidyltransferase domain-containing protein n=1 Tax=Clostridium ganghwense TaxID=312089 RepID=A0ABT4CT68_9CLOT|nr:nucleotidyltransferase domain-containing protein [Clostridium ganghwense]MCY6371144.1 nucleotidyltransferase domain-containing protein [Clostridium ganghwense]
MIKLDAILQKIIEKFSQLEEVEGILLAGSHTTNTQDENSDYDIYIYSNSELPVAKRVKIIKEFCDYMEINNQFWETEDDGIITKENIPIEIIYRNLNWINEQLEKVLIKFQADVGYTTCIWSNFITSVILYDKNGELKKLKQKYNLRYPEELKLNIIRKNYPLLRKQMPAYYFQIEKAIKRNDYISVNHRITALLASYFDILFAINEMPHPGEKKLVKILKNKSEKLPVYMEENLNNLMKNICNYDESILIDINNLVDNLDTLLEKENIKF